MSYLRSFAPWILYAVLSSVDWRIGTCAAAVALLVADQARKHDLDLLTEATFAFFGVMAIIALAAPHSGLHHWTPALSAATLAVIAGASLAARRPFTAAIAKRTVPAQFWSTPAFVHSNDVITGVWAAAFACSAVACALIIHTSPGSTTPVIVAQVLGFIIPFAFTKTYTERSRRLTAPPPHSPPALDEATGWAPSPRSAGPVTGKITLPSGRSCATLGG